MIIFSSCLFYYYFFLSVFLRKDKVNDHRDPNAGAWGLCTFHLFFPDSLNKSELHFFIFNEV